jgi:hypothetical protein
MEAAMASARQRGVHRLTATMLASNEPIRRLLLSAGGRVLRHCIEAGVASMEIESDESPREGGS